MNTPAETWNPFFSAFHSGGVSLIVLIVLGLCSVLSWAVIFAKYFSFKQAKKDSDGFLDLFWNAKSLEGIFAETKNFSASPVSNVFRAGYIEFQKVTAKSQEKGVANKDIAEQGLDNVQRALRKASTAETLRLEQKVNILSTIAATAPFIGLFGTVWGIMNSFHGLGTEKAASIQVVAPGVSEALIATAAGLIAAIPAVVFYNQFAQSMRWFRAEMDNFSSDFTNILKRNYLG